MLTYEVKEAILLLKRIEYGQGRLVTEQMLPEASRIFVRGVLKRLCDSGLLRIVDNVGADPLCFRYALCRPLSGVTLYDILRITGGYIHLSMDDESMADDYGLVGRRLNVVNDMACRLLSEIRLVEIVLPERLDMKE